MITKGQFIKRMIESALKNQVYLHTKDKKFKGDYNPNVDFGTEATILLNSIVELFKLEDVIDTPSNT